MYYRGMTLRRWNSFNGNHVDVDTDEEYWVSGPRRDSNAPVHIDDDARAEYDALVAGTQPQHR